MMKYACFLISLVKLATAVCNTCPNGYQFVMPSSLTIPRPDRTNSNFDQCNLIGGVFQCSYHSLFDCNTNINSFYSWYTNGRQRITTQFQTPIQIINILTFFPSSVTSTRLRIQVSAANTAEGSMVHPEQMIYNFRADSNGGHYNFEGSFSSDVNGVNIDIYVSSKITIRIIFCASQATVPQGTSSMSQLLVLSMMSSSKSTMLPSLSPLSISPLKSTTSPLPSTMPLVLSTISPLSLSTVSSSLSTVSLNGMVSLMPPSMSSSLAAISPIPTATLSSNPLSASFDISYSLMRPGPSSCVQAEKSVEASTTGWVVSVTILATLLLLVTLLLITVTILYCKKLSVITKMTRLTTCTDATELTDYYEVSRHAYPRLLLRTSPLEDSSNGTVQHNPSYELPAQPKRRRQLNDNYDYVVTDSEMIETDHNPSYVTTTVGSNELQDNPAYKPAFTAVV